MQNKLKTTWSIDKDQDLRSDILKSDVRRELLRELIIDEDADWGVVRSSEDLEAHLDYLMGYHEDFKD